jgi:hypothetical protein
LKPTVNIVLHDKGKAGQIVDSLTDLVHRQVLVGIPDTSTKERRAAIKKAVGMGKKGPRKKHWEEMAKHDINNAQLMYIHTHGSPARNIPPRPVIEASIMETTNQNKITEELKKTAEAALDGQSGGVSRGLKVTGLLAETLARDWFTNPKNHWAPNAPRTIQRKKSDKPLIDTAVMRKSIVHVIVNS